MKWVDADDAGVRNLPRSLFLLGWSCWSPERASRLVRKLAEYRVYARVRTVAIA